MASTASVKVSVFLSTPSARRATRSSVSRSFRRTFLSTPSARRATFPAPRLCHKVDISIHALREEGDAPAGGCDEFCGISIHALREEGDCWQGRCRYRRRYFYPRPPRGGRRRYRLATRLPAGFLSTPSARRATQGGMGYHHCRPISIHALREEGDADKLKELMTDLYISIHALREEGDMPIGNLTSQLFAFLSTPSARRATALALCHAGCSENFYPRPPRGGRLVPARESLRCKAFLSTPSARRATLDRQLRQLSSRISIHALREEGDIRS